jgi:subfamily B ATP-binding cassette protein MsbA
MQRREYQMKLNFQDWKILWFFFRPYKLQSLSVLALMFISGTLEAMNLAALYPIINYGLNLGKKSFILENFEKIAQRVIPGNIFLVSCVLLILISILAFIFKFVYNYMSSRLTALIMGDIQKKMFEKLSAADYGFYVKNQQGRLIYAGTLATDKTSQTILYTLQCAYNSINVALLFSLLIFLSWQATLLIVLLGAVYTFVTREITHKSIHKFALIRTEENQRKNIVLNEFITGIKTIKIYLASGEWRTRHARAVEGELGSQFQISVVEIIPEILMKFSFFLVMALIGIVLSQGPRQQVIVMLPVLGTFAVIISRFLPSLALVGASFMQIVKCLPDTRIVHEFCREEFTMAPDGIQEMHDFKDKITFENVTFKYSNMEDDLLRDLSFSLEKQKMTAIVGLSGSGKTTIINLLLKLYPVDKGAIKIDGVDIAELRNNSYLSRIGYVSQETFIFNSSIKENIKFGMDNCTDSMIEEAAKLANAHDFIIETQNGYDTLVGDAGVKLSGGQRQRLAIARAMLRAPEIIVFDEATSSLDNISEKKIQNAINNISKHTTVLVVAHRLSTVQNADKIIILEKGKIKEQGTHEELIKNKDLYYMLQMSQRTMDEISKG